MVSEQRPYLAFDVVEVCSLLLRREVGHVEAFADSFAGVFLSRSCFCHNTDPAKASFAEELSPSISETQTAVKSSKVGS